jgi:L-lactate dehydrogenase (cytochrome)
MTRRQLPRVRDLRPLLRFKRPELNRTTRRLSAALTVEDLGVIARRRTPQAPFDYTDGAADDELSLARARQAFADIEFYPRILRNVSTTNTEVDILGAGSALPFGIAPTGFTRMMHTDGERAERPRQDRRASRSPCQPWARPRSRTSHKPTPPGGTGSSSTCGRTATGPWR